MNNNLKKIISCLILAIGVFAFVINIYNNNLNVALIYITVALISWVLYILFLDIFDVQIFAGIISAAGFLIAISVLFMFGIEEVPYPMGAVVFHSGGLAGALGIALFSLFPILVIHQMNNANSHIKPNLRKEVREKKPDPEILSENWEIASEDDLRSGEFETS